MSSSVAFRLCLSLGLLSLGACSPEVASPPSDAFLRAMNLGKAHLENKESAKAIAAFEEAAELRPESPEVWRNLARSQLLARQYEAALAALDRAGDSGVATRYLRGLVHARESRFEEALPELEEAVRLDPHTAALRFQLALAYQSLGMDAEAREQLLETVRLDPMHTGAHYRLSSFARRDGDREEFEARQRELQRLRDLPGGESRPAEAWETCRYTRAEIVQAAREEALAEISVRFAEPSSDLGGTYAALREAVAVAPLGVDERGRYTLFLAQADGRLVLLGTGEDGRPEAVALALELPGSAVLAGAPKALAADFHDLVPMGKRFDPTRDALTDLLLLGPEGAHLLRRVEAGAFEEVTEAAGLAELAGRRAVWVDVEHDGDVDLWVAADSGPRLWRNRGDGTFEEATEEVGVAGEEPAVDVSAADFEADVAVDLVAARGDGPTRIFQNRRAGSFAPSPEPPGPWPPARRILAEDLDSDGLPELVLLGEEELVIVPGGGGERPRLPLGAFEGRALALIDYDNDGRPDLAAGGIEQGAGRLRLWRNGGPGPWREVSEEAGLAALTPPAPRELLVLDLDTDGDSDLLAIGAGGSQIFLNEGGHAAGQVKVSLLGAKTNPVGIGARLEARRGGFLATRTVQGPVTEIGLGGGEGLDSLLAVWTNGIVDNQVEVETHAPLTVLEPNVASGSCPYLYAWDGRTFRFVTDLLGNSPVGLSIRRGEVLPADPDELVWIGPEASLPPREGSYVLQVTEELREVLYLDEAHLVAVDHAPGVEVHPTDRLGPEPFPPSELWAVAAPRMPLLAHGDDGVDRTADLAAVDGRYAPPGLPLPPPMRGMAHPLALTLDFGPLDDLRRPVLALTGWLQYGDASTNIALSQSRAWRIVPPTLEAEDASGRWHTLPVVLGMPAGKTKTIVAELTGLLPPGARRLRLKTSFEIRWDRIALGERLGRDALAEHPLAPTRAELFFRGFSEIRSRAPGHPTTPRHMAVSPRPPWRTTPEGWVTRHGDVLDLALRRDERLVILNGGDALELHFPASALPPVPPGKVRTFFFHSVGWDKDADHNVIAGDRVLPLPVASTADDWRERYNTRWVPADRFGDRDSRSSSVEIRYYIDPESGEPHLYRHGVSEDEAAEVLRYPGDDLPGRRDSRLALGQIVAGRYLQVVYVPDPDRRGVFVVTAYDLKGRI